jgi:ATP-dependent Clp protease ATP-binding subunit ClpA
MKLRRRRPPIQLAPVIAELFEAAQGEAIAFRHSFIGSEHVLLALLGRNDEAGRVLRQLGLDADGVRADVRRIVGEGPAPEEVFDADALRAIGIDLKAVRERAEAAFGGGALERARLRRGHCGGAAFGISPRLKQAIERASKETAQGGAELTAAAVALGLAHQRDSVAARILDAHGISPERLGAALRAPQA